MALSVRSEPMALVSEWEQAEAELSTGWADARVLLRFEEPGRIDRVTALLAPLQPLRAGEAMINPKGTWHRGVVREPGSALFITSGFGTEHRPMDTSPAD